MASRQAVALNRFGLGASPGDSAGDDPQSWLTAQLHRFDPAPPAIAALPDRAALVAEFGAYQMVRADAKAGRRAPATGTTAPASPVIEAARKQAGQTLRQDYVAAIDARLTSALTTPTPFPERLVHFWSNHFAISAEKLPVIALAGDYEFTAIRPHVMGRFADLAWAAITHPAMLVFLDQAQSIGPNSMFAAGGPRRLGLNENLAREIMELHTLGARTGYTQADVTEFARALTGWTVAGLGGGPGQRRLLEVAKPGDTLFAPPLHEPGARTILGRRYTQEGPALARAIVSDLCAAPATARHIATKLARHITADDPPPSLVARLERNFTVTGGDLPSLYRALISSPEPWEAAAKFKSPWDWTVSSLRAVGAERLPTRQGAAAMLDKLGQPVWRPGSPAGWDDTDAAWAGAGALMTRVELAERIAGRVGNAIDPRALAPGVLPGAALSPATARAIARADSPAQGLALLLAAPEFMRR